MEITNIFITGF